MDNCSIHKGKEVEALIHQAGARLIYLPPYSPDFSPIENCWSKIKNVLRSVGARSYPDLAQAIDQAFQRVSLQDIRNWFIHCCYCTSLDQEKLYSTNKEQDGYQVYFRECYKLLQRLMTIENRQNYCYLEQLRSTTVISRLKIQFTAASLMPNG